MDDLLSELGGSDIPLTHLDAWLGQGRSGLRVLTAPPTLERRARIEEHAYRSVALWLRRFAGLLIFDCPGLEAPATRAAVECADQVLVVTEAVPEAGPALGRTVGVVRRHDRSAVVVANGLHRPLDARAMRRLAVSAPEADGLVVVPWSPAGATQLRRGAFEWTAAPPEWMRSTCELAAVLAADWSRLGLLSTGAPAAFSSEV